ncbi:MAG: hypothetical protein M2R45_02478 [Verrucomicrobia subdivision 3 bacterium]|nr:hypothetical protein [Limisphaerales bacterium]MCS1413266.1 hypothetical protein [Limisphaerales bacterium]
MRWKTLKRIAIGVAKVIVAIILVIIIKALFVKFINPLILKFFDKVYETNTEAYVGAVISGILIYYFVKLIVRFCLWCNGHVKREK